jgi:hypothetical protein
MTTKSPSPSVTVSEKFGDKAKLVEAVQKLAGQDLWVARENEGKGLAHVSNAKLLRLLATFTAVQAKFGTRVKLIDAVLEAEGRSKDTGYKSLLEGWPVPRLFDRYQAMSKRQARAKKAAG